LPNEQPIYNELELLIKVSQGDENAFRALMHRWYEPLAGFIFKLTRSEENLEEIVQDVFFKIWITRESLAEVKSFKHYLLIIGRNHALNVMKKVLRERKLRRSFQTEWNPVREDDEAALLYKKANSLIDEAIDSLPRRRKEVYLLSRHERFTYQEIAEKLNISRESVKTHLKLASESITKFIKEHLTQILILILTSFK
jgi:RNA polymerase sigma-70 factor (ECF subfamily)